MAVQDIQYLEPELHAPISLYEGPITIAVHGTTIAVDGRYLWTWLPTPCLRFQGTMVRAPDDALQWLFEDSERQFLAPTAAQPGTPSTTLAPTGMVVTLDELVKNTIEVGRGQPLRSLRFNIVNALHLGNTPLEATALGWRLELDPIPGFAGLRDDLQRTGGYATTHVGAISRVRGGRFSVGKGLQVVEAACLLLSFTAGRGVAGCLPRGTDGVSETWAKWSVVGHLQPYRECLSWFDPFLTSSVPALWPTLLAAHQNDPAAVRAVVGYYVHSNVTHPVDVGLSVAASGLDLLGWLLVVSKGHTSKTAWSDLNWADQVRAVLDQCSIPYSIPSELTRLIRAAQRLGLADGPAAIVKARNRFTHPGGKTQQLNPGETIEAWKLSTWYLEMACLRFFEYSARYKRRTSNDRWVGSTELVPWAGSPGGGHVP